MKICKNNIINVIIIVFLVIALGFSKVKAVDDVVVSPENWEDWEQKEYWEWYTRVTSDDKAYNGNHIVIEDSVINFYGYWNNSYKDFLYKEYENPGKKIFKFIIDESKANYHTLDGAGFIFNASKIDNKLSGYILLFKQKEICIYRIDDVDIEKFQVTPNTTIQNYGELIGSIPKTDSNVHNLTVETTPINMKVIESETELLNVDLDYSKHVGNSFGLISSYVQHSCKILSHIEFYQLEILLEDYEISVLNTDMDGTPLSGGYFELKDENGEIVKEGTTNKEGKFTITGLKEGIYTVQQKTPPMSYNLNDTVYTFKVTNEGKVIDTETEQEIELIIKNDKIEEDTNIIEDNINNVVDDEENTITNNIIENTEDNTKNNTINKNNSSKSDTTNKINSAKDNTRANKIIPYTGGKLGIISIISILMIISIFSFAKLKKYQSLE